MMASRLKRNKITPFSIFLFIVLSLYVLSILVVLGWGVLTSLKDAMDYRMNGAGALPSEQYGWHFENYITAYTKNRVPVYFEGEGTYFVYMDEMIVNSLLYSIGAAFFATRTPCVVAYACQRYNFKYLKVLFSIVIITMLLPIVGSLPSEMTMMRNLGFLDNGPIMEYIGVLFMKSNFLGLYFLVFYASFQSIPRDYEEAAFIDGASHFKVMLGINMPLVKSTIACVFLLNFIGAWNDYQTPMIFWPSRPTLAYGMYMFKFSTEKEILNSVPLTIAGGIMMVIPIIILYVIASKKLLGNITTGGIKG